MTPRDLAVRALLCAAAAFTFAALLLLAILGGLVIEVVDDVRSSRIETKRIPRGNMSNRKLWDSTSQLKAANAKLVAVVGQNTAQAKAELSDARQLADEVTLFARRAS